jgi:hypothetical protein
MLADARLAAESRVDCVYVSNNGDRSLDHARGAIVTLPEIVDAAAERAEVICRRRLRARQRRAPAGSLRGLGWRTPP